MTKKEFNKISSIKEEIDNLEKELDDAWGSKISHILRIYLGYTKKGYTIIRVPSEIYLENLKLVKEKLEKLKEEFYNFKTE